MNKRILLLLAFLLMLSIIFVGCASSNTPAEEPVKEEPVAEEPVLAEPVAKDGVYPNGTYRGIFEDSGYQQVSVQFKMNDGNISDIKFRHLYHDGTDYGSLEEGAPLYGIKFQHLQIAEYFEGKPIESISELYNPGDFIDDVDVSSGATIRGNKVISAIRDGLNRGPYTPDGDYDLVLPDYQDGTYRGMFGDSGDQQVSIEFMLKDGNIHDITFRHLYYNGTNYRTMEESNPLYGILQQHMQLAEYFEGKPLASIVELYDPGSFIDDVDVSSGATIRSNKVYSAIRDGLNRGIYSPSNGYTSDLGSIEDGRYRGTFGDRGEQQVAIQFSVEGGIIKDLSYRYLNHSGNDYRAMLETDPLYGVYGQYIEVLEYLEGKPIEKIYDLHNPGGFIDDVDVSSGATIRANKVFSAIMNGLSRGLY